jgi:hypothetical protein
MPSSLHSSHYSWGQEPDRLIRWSHEKALELDHLLDEIEPRSPIPIFCYRGMSGTAHATALSLAWYSIIRKPFGMIYVRKPEEDSHGNSHYERALGQVEGHAILVFVDEQISSGDTQRETLRKARACIDEFNIIRTQNDGWDSDGKGAIQLSPTCFTVLKHDIQTGDFWKVV